MPTADELRAGIAGGRAALRLAIQACADNWETPNADEWSPRMVAEHAVPAEIMLATSICAACGADGPENPLSSTEFATAADALAALEAVAAASDAKLQHVQDDELGGIAGTDDPFGQMTAGYLMQSNTWHLADHAAQMMRPPGL